MFALHPSMGGFLVFSVDVLGPTFIPAVQPPPTFPHVFEVPFGLHPRSLCVGLVPFPRPGSQRPFVILLTSTIWLSHQACLLAIPLVARPSVSFHFHKVRLFLTPFSGSPACVSNALTMSYLGVFSLLELFHTIFSTTTRLSQRVCPTPLLCFGTPKCVSMFLVFVGSLATISALLFRHQLLNLHFMKSTTCFSSGTSLW